MKMKMLAVAAVAVMVSAVFAQGSSKIAFKEDFEKAKVNSQGKLVISSWYSPSKLKEHCEVTITRKKLDVFAGKFACKYSNMNDKQQIYMLHETGVIKVDPAKEKIEVSVQAKGTGYFLIALVFYADGKFLRSAGIAPIAGKQALPSKAKPFADADWTTCYGQIAKIPADAKNCKVAIFVMPKSEIYLDDIEVKLVQK